MNINEYKCLTKLTKKSKFNKALTDLHFFEH